MGSMRASDGKRYNLGKYRMVASWISGHYSGDFHEVEEELYLSPGGQWLLWGYGGALTEYAEPALGGGFGAGSALRVISLDEAREWLYTRRIGEDEIPEDLIDTLMPEGE